MGSTVSRISRIAPWALLALLAWLGCGSAFAETGLQNVKHIVIVVQENHSFDNYFGALAYAPGSPYHNAGKVNRGRDRDHDGDRDNNNGNDGCRADDHSCVDGLTCSLNGAGLLQCVNSNPDEDGSTVRAFHDARRCVAPDLAHGWVEVHQQTNLAQPNDGLKNFLGDGFVITNDRTEQHDNGVETPTEDQTMAFYNQDQIPFYYDLAQKFALNDRYFSPVLGPTFPNRSYLMAATSFGHLTTSDELPPPGGYKPITGTIFDLMDRNHVTWADYFQDAPQGGSFRLFGAGGVDPHFKPFPVFLAQAAGAPGVGPLPDVSFVDPNFGLTGRRTENDEHPPTDIQRGQAYVSQVINAVRNGPNWKDTIIFVTYDEHGGFFDHARPPRAPQFGARTPDGINPGQCEDLSNPPASEQPGGGAECSTNFLNPADSSLANAERLCPALAANPTGPFPPECASFDQLGFRVPFLAISPFSKPHYVSHSIGDHTSLLALIEKRFLNGGTTGRGGDDADDQGRPRGMHLTRRDAAANTLEDMFDFEHSPSLNTPVGMALPPADDCTPP